MIESDNHKVIEAIKALYTHVFSTDKRPTNCAVYINNDSIDLYATETLLMEDKNIDDISNLLSDNCDYYTVYINTTNPYMVGRSITEIHRNITNDQYVIIVAENDKIVNNTLRNYMRYSNFVSPGKWAVENNIFKKVRRVSKSENYKEKF